MNKATNFLPLFFILSITLPFLLPNAAYASPAMVTYDSRPQNYLETGGVSVTNPTNAYDNNLATYATFRYDPGTAGTFEVKNFTKPSSNPIAFVDFKMHYGADAGGAGEEYRIVYYVKTTGPVVLQGWTSSAHAAATVVWMSQAEPIDGTWNWTDINNIRFIVETKTGGGGSSDFDEYEAWVTAFTYRKPTVYVDPASQTDPSSPFTIKINISTVDDLYAWEFKLYYNKTILTISSVTLGPLLNNTVGTANTWGTIHSMTDDYNATHGLVWAAQSILGRLAGATTNVGTLASLTFTVDGPSGTTPLALADTKLRIYDNTNIRLAWMLHDTTDGSVTISAAPEFPMGLALEIALIVVVIYIWRRKRRGEPRIPFSGSQPLS